MRAPDVFATELEKLIGRFRMEWDLSYSEAVGCLAHASYTLHREWEEEEEESGYAND